MKSNSLVIIFVLFLSLVIISLLSLTFSLEEGFTEASSNVPLFESSTNTNANLSLQHTPMTQAPGTDILSFGQIPIPSSGIPTGYYQTGTTSMSSIPLGYIASPDNQSIVPQVQTTIVDLSSNTPYSVISTNASNSFTNDSSNNITHYDANNYNITYHANPTDLSNNSLTDMSINIPDATYYQPGSFPYGPSTWIPSYEDSVYLSKLTGYSSNSPLYNTASMKSGFCVHYQNDPQKLEEQCNKLDQNVCASTSCCVLLGSSKCVSGNQNGPIMKSNYSDFFVPNREFYYYSGKCYGNCQE
jgi:hypothetical protein